MKSVYISTVFFILILTTLNLNAQDLTKHRWENRLILIISKHPTSNKLLKQKQEFKALQSELGERKLLIYEILPEKFRKFESSISDWSASDVLYKKYNSNSDEFKVILIGLDGGIKINQNDILTKQDLFSTIDTMPMRRAEIKNKA